MSISQRDFNRQCVGFVSTCRKLDGHWTLLKQESKQISEITPCNVHAKDLDKMKLMLTKNELRLAQPNNQVYTYEYNVIYSDSYEVPVMYFSASRQDGSLVSLDDIISPLFEYKQNGVLEELVNQVEHPILFRPFYMIHPCRTKDFMSLHNSSNYLICWLSTVGTVIDLKLDLNIAKLFG